MVRHTVTLRLTIPQAEELHTLLERELDPSFFDTLDIDSVARQLDAEIQRMETAEHMMREANLAAIEAGEPVPYKSIRPLTGSRTPNDVRPNYPRNQKGVEL